MLSEAKTAPPISFSNYKINYDVCLGSRAFSSVYEVVERPVEERGILAGYCPYLYDYYFRVEPTKKIVTPLCIKVSHTALKVLFKGIKNTESLIWGLSLAKHSFRKLSNNVRQIKYYANSMLPK